MDTLPATLTGPFGLRFALRGRRLALIVLVPVVWALGAPPSWASLLGGLLGLGLLAFVYEVGSRPKAWGHLLDSLAPVGLVATLIGTTDAAPVAQLGAAFIGCLVAPIWTLFPFIVPTVPLAAVRAEAERWAAEAEAGGTPFTNIRLVLASVAQRGERNDHFVVKPAGMAMYKEARPAFTVRTRVNEDDLPPGPASPLIPLWTRPTTAHGILAWTAKTRPM